MAKGAGIPGLDKALTEEDLEESRNIYNNLPDDAKQPEIQEYHILDLAALFVRNRAHNIFGIHLVHAHFTIPTRTVLLGANYDRPRCRWARTTPIPDMDLSDIHGHIFVLRDNGFRPYEYQTGPAPDLSQIDDMFLHDLSDYLYANNLSSFIGLQIVDENPANMLELILPQATVMLCASDLNGCISTRQTGWRFETELGQPRVCQANESHGQRATTHEIYNKGDAHPRMETYEDLKDALLKIGIIG
ncbi:hypothetical protein H634G_05658 [Metarhizium anisopliae BRIP 53293]|uniref:Uncharacterized protein n=1 Tax=Metarhizium anisopliae BRIP 53293 TaxID=1291518 RepID=A0A0D9NXT6_METAN|nr:hypothetical protein H634G_05658 [Metarhizium anisopliae BRIP 53293]KJK93676.1 hypothetical protein H633G_02472 [Metarhizium anisopliae BRIP 53284]